MRYVVKMSPTFLLLDVQIDDLPDVPSTSGTASKSKRIPEVGDKEKIDKGKRLKRNENGIN